MKTFIGEWMEHLNTTPEKVGEAAGISPKIIQRWLREETTPSVAQLDQVSRAIGITMDDLTRLNPKDSIVKSVDLSQEESPIVKTFIKEWADKMEVTAADIAEHTKLPIVAIQEWLDKKSNPTLMQASIIAASFGITVDDLLQRDPNKFYNDYLDNHYMETRDIKVAVRFQNWLSNHRIKNEVVVFRSKDHEVFMVRYNSKVAYEPLDIVRISLKRKFRDSREKEPKTSEKRYDKMEVVVID